MDFHKINQFGLDKEEMIAQFNIVLTQKEVVVDQVVDQVVDLIIDQVGDQVEDLIDVLVDVDMLEEEEEL